METGNNISPMPSKISPRLRLLDNSLSKDSSKQYYLCLEIGVSGLSFAIYSKAKNSFLAIVSFEFEKVVSETEIILLLEQLTLENEWLKLQFTQVNILINNSICTLVPSALFNEQEKKRYLGFNQTVSKNDAIKHNFLSNTQAFNIYSLPETLADFLVKKWPEANVIHYTSCVIEALSNQFKNRADNKSLYVNVRDESLDIVFFKDAKLFYNNNFKFKSKEDFIYFLLLAMEQMGLSPEETKVGLTGKIDEGSAIYQILHEYIRHHYFIERNDAYKYSDLLNEATCRQYYILLNQLQCV
jgi:hypothetical protein